MPPNTTPCAYGHGTDYRGGDLPKTQTARSLPAEGDGVVYTAGQKVDGYHCHNGPRGGSMPSS